jgi:RNA polymerase sigma factor (sigma-70 family)
MAKPGAVTGVHTGDDRYNSPDVRTARLPARTAARPIRVPRRLLALASDERLVEQIRYGNEAAFEVAFERYGPPILSYCRHMLGSPEEAEDAVQHSFAAAYGDLQRDERPIKLKPWLFTIARNRCLSMLRARRERPLEDREVATAGLAEQVERRAELRDLVRDLGDLPEEQRAALLLAEVGDLSHAEVAQVLGCRVAKVKALVFRARTGLIERREAREKPCEEIREQLANLRGGSLRRSELRHHLRGCPGCREYREQVKRQRRMLAVALPVTPSLGLKSAVLGSVGFGGASAGGGALMGGLGAAASGSLGSTIAKVAVVGALVGGGAVGGEQVLSGSDGAPAGGEATRGVAAPEDARPGPGADGAAGGERGAAKQNGGKARRRGRYGGGPAAGPRGRARGHARRAAGKQKAARRAGKPAKAPKAAKGGPQGNGRGAGPERGSSGQRPAAPGRIRPGGGRTPAGEGSLSGGPVTTAPRPKSEVPAGAPRLLPEPRSRPRTEAPKVNPAPTGG